MTEPQPHIGIIVHQRSDDAEELLARIVAGLRDKGLRLGGIYQQTSIAADGGKQMAVIDIASGRKVAISQDLGPGSESCCLDPSGLAEASALLRREIDRRVDLLIISKFAGLEAEGRGLAPDLFHAITCGLPVLTLLSDRYLADWRTLCGDIGDRLPPTEEAVLRWVDALPSVAG